MPSASGVRWLLVALVGVVALRLLFCGGAGEPDVRELELALYRVEQRQRMIDRDVFALGALLAERNATWRALAAAALERGTPPAPPEPQQQGVPPPKRPTAFVPAPFASRPEEIALAGPAGGGSPWPKAAWGKGPPPDAYFALPQCAARRVALAPEAFHEYALADADACQRAALGLRVEPACPEQKLPLSPVRARRQVLVTGVQRSGTHFTWEMFNRLGVHVHHEGLGPGGSISWLYSWNAKSYAINNPDPLRDQRFCVVLHQVRHPLRVLSSIVKSTKAGDRFWVWLCNVEPELKCAAKPPLLALAARLWLLQNARIEQYADARFRVEETSPRDVCRAAGFADALCANDGRHHTTSSRVVQPIIEPHVATAADVEAARLKGKVPSITWADLEQADADLAEQVKAMTKRYGYDLDPMQHPQSLDTATFKA
ncbi:hypothetical protein M885DRAFT_615122 [Pelagophyceae sp. CCMP2097]|nr:hypothetical protein M885DRAFT_615122 [Pelagophyceae sp. CCMP2097]|mmetsp:Transcript_20234/g.68542  ORF Transcript_20234/g.68542 Transcript_20234/m.68542 type:complete len:430 (-) Transcript_20234:69-1358(-)|eukprot:CAMPEP_0184079976 /NCGR_PEP_ID=MMETSP0974-20121125/1962_1 /TAXON_ID=483370 /ORGANISM="non described non described, Strain CCMP2097" /LENGTH=429 /DNA_ID=CAMNT_0026382625 /DNA_START=45 /DNA_END=1334 /DNA_ORIENTATION=-